MKTKFMAGLIASLISLVLVVGCAILITAYVSPKTGDRLVKLVAGVTILIWLGLYSWLKPKVNTSSENQNKSESNTSASVNETPSSDPKKDRNSYH